MSNVVGALKASFLSGRAVVVRLSRAVSSAANGGGSMTVNVVAVAPSDRPLWFPGSTPPEWLDGSCVCVCVCVFRFYPLCHPSLLLFSDTYRMGLGNGFRV